MVELGTTLIPAVWDIWQVGWASRLGKSVEQVGWASRLNK
jgi:hypothetical protein